MRGSTSDISIKVIANSTGLASGLSDAEKKLAQFQSQVNGIGKKVSNGLAKALAPYAAGVSVAGFVATITSAVNRLDDLGDFADGLGDSAPKISKIEYAVERLGGSAEATRDIMSKMSKSIGEAADIGGPSADAIAKIGLNINELKQMRPSDAFIAIVDAIGRVPNVYARAAIGADIFGRGAKQINAVLKAGSGDLQKYMDRADALGISVTDNMINVGGRAKDAFTDISGIANGFANVLAEELTPKIADSIESIHDMSDAFDSVRLTARFASDSMDYVSGVVNPLIGSVKALTGGLLALDYIWNEIGMKIGIPLSAKDNLMRAEMADSLKNEGMDQIFGKAEKSLKKAGESVEDFTERMHRSRKAVTKTGDALADAFARMPKIADTGPSWIDEYTKLLQDAVKKTDDAARAMEQRIKSFGESLTESMMTPMEKYVSEMAKIDEARAAGVITPETAARAAKKLFDDAKDAGLVNGVESKDARDKLREFGEELTRSVRTPMEEYQDKLKEITDALKKHAITAETAARATKIAWREMMTASGAESIAGYRITDWGQQMLDYNMPRGGFVGGNVPSNFRFFTDPVTSAMNGGRSTFNPAEFASIAYQPVDDQGNWLQDIATNTAVIAENTQYTGMAIA